MSRAEHMNPGCVRAAGLAGGAAVSVLLAAATGTRWPLILAVALLVGTVVEYARAVDHRHERGKSWPSWCVGTLVALLLAWALPGSRVLLLPWAGVEALIAVGMFAWWRAHLDGRRDWLIVADQDVVVRREMTRREAQDGADYYLRDMRYPLQSLTVIRVDKAPALANRTPLYPDANQPPRSLRSAN